MSCNDKRDIRQEAIEIRYFSNFVFEGKRVYPHRTLIENETQRFQMPHKSNANSGSLLWNIKNDDVPLLVPSFWSPDLKLSDLLFIDESLACIGERITISVGAYVALSVHFIYPSPRPAAVLVRILHRQLSQDPSHGPGRRDRSDAEHQNTDSYHFKNPYGSLVRPSYLDARQFHTIQFVNNCS